MDFCLSTYLLDKYVIICYTLCVMFIVNKKKKAIRSEYVIFRVTVEEKAAILKAGKGRSISDIIRTNLGLDD